MLFVAGSMWATALLLASVDHFGSSGNGVSIPGALVVVTCCSYRSAIRGQDDPHLAVTKPHCEIPTVLVLGLSFNVIATSSAPRSSDWRNASPQDEIRQIFLRAARCAGKALRWGYVPAN
jgi:hypothetical protein